MMRQRIVRLFAVAAAVAGLASACASNDDATEQQGSNNLLEVNFGEPLAPLELCVAFAYAEDGSDLCTHDRAPTGREVGVLQARLACPKSSSNFQWATALLQANAAGRVHIDWNLARECLESSRDLRTSLPGIEVLASAAWRELQDGACAAFYRGTVKEGEVCVDDWDCEDGLGCYTLNPFDPEEKTCERSGQLGDQCDESFWPCAPGFYCSSGGFCLALVGAGGSCQQHDECLSGRCGGSPAVCAPVPVARELNEPCTADFECQQHCGVCRRQMSGGMRVCSLLGSAGSYCETSLECARGLACKDERCVPQKAGDACGLELGAFCPVNAECVASVNCAAMETAQACNNYPDDCVFLADHGCVVATGECVQLSSIGPCSPNATCADGSYCTPLGQCQPYVSAGAACSPTRTDAAPLCIPGLVCADGACAFPCGRDSDCQADEYCDPSTDPGACRAGLSPSSSDACINASQCGDGEFCNRCNIFVNQAGCLANEDCAWAESGYCRATVNCAQFDHNESACLDMEGCGYTPDTGWCDPVVSCLASSRDACEEISGCSFIAVNYCTSTQGGQAGKCEPLRHVGEHCAIQGGAAGGLGESEMCQSGYCMESNDGAEYCTVTPSGCTDFSGSMIHFTFLFGLMGVAGQRRHRTLGHRDG